MSLFIYYVFDENTSRDAPESGAGEKLVEEKNIVDLSISFFYRMRETDVLVVVLT
jgi:hypothetical protein